MRSYIPLNALRAFEAAARHLSFTRAASELCVTPTAISHQIRSLEEFLDTSLFERKNGKLILTPATHNALQELSEGFNKLESALLALNRRGGRRKITVAASPSVAALWLMPRLQRFFLLAPDIDVSLSTVIAPSDFGDGAYDVSICGADDYPGRKVEPLMQETLVPVCAPSLLAGLSAAEALADLPLIHDDKANEQFPTWRRYFETVHMTRPDCAGGLRFNQSNLAIDAAIRGHGVVLGRSLLIARAVADGQLVTVGAPSYPTPCSYCTVRQRGEELPAVRTFLAWLTSEVEADHDQPVLAAPSLRRTRLTRQGVRIAVGPDQRNRLADVDWRREEQLVGD